MCLIRNKRIWDTACVRTTTGTVTMPEKFEQRAFLKYYLKFGQRALDTLEML